MAGSQRGQAIPTQLGSAQFEQFVLPHLSVGSRGPAPKLSLFKIFNYILRQLYMGCQWKELPIAGDDEGCPEIHYTRIYGAFRRWEADGCIDAIFVDSVLKLKQDSWRWHHNGGQEGRRQHRLQWAQEGEGRQDCRLL
jgi:transposase